MSLARQQRSPRGNARSAGFDFTLHVRHLCDDLIARVKLLRHVDMARVAMSFSQTRKVTGYGMYASLTPMRFADGKPHTVRQGRKWTVQRLHNSDGREMLYILTFYLPRFLDLPLGEKLATVVHELWHISPQFNGDVRRFRGRCFAHGSSQKQYDAQVDRLVGIWQSKSPPSRVYRFLRHNFHDLQVRHGRVFGQRVPVPKLIPVD